MLECVFSNKVIDCENERIEVLQGILLGFLSGNMSDSEDLVTNNCRQFFWTQLLEDEVLRKRRIGCSEKEMASLDERQKYLLLQISSDSQANKIHIDYGNACLITQYLASERHFSQVFAEHLHKMIDLCRDSCIEIQWQAMKSLTMIAEIDASILKQTNVQKDFLIHPISVREKTVDLIGKCILKRPSLINRYYGLLLMGIRDAGVSVRKRVIKILRDIVIEYPTFGKNTEICMELMKRANEDGSVRELIADAFVQMWFTPCAGNDKVSPFGLRLRD